MEFQPLAAIKRFLFRTHGRPQEIDNDTLKAVLGPSLYGEES